MRKFILTGLLLSLLFVGTSFAQEWVPVKYCYVKATPKVVTWHWEGMVMYKPIYATPTVPVAVWAKKYPYLEPVCYVPCNRPPCPVKKLLGCLLAPLAP
jgi:hypothetical protein